MFSHAINNLRDLRSSVANLDLFNAVAAGAKAEADRIRTAAEAKDSLDKPLAVVPGGSQRFYLEIDLRNGEVSLREWWSGDSSRPEYVWRGDAVWIDLSPYVTHGTLAAFLSEHAEEVATAASVRSDSGQGWHSLQDAVSHLDQVIVLDVDDWYRDAHVTGRETEDEIRQLAEDGLSNGIAEGFYPAFDLNGAIQHLSERVEDKRCELNEAA